MEGYVGWWCRSIVIDIMIIPVVFYDIIDDDIHVDLNVFMIILDKLLLQYLKILKGKQ